MMANLVAESGAGKGQLSYLVEAICRVFRLHDETELKKLVEWQKQVKTKGANKEKPVRPDVAFWFPPSPQLLRYQRAIAPLGGEQKVMFLAILVFLGLASNL